MKASNVIANYVLACAFVGAIVLCVVIIGGK